MLVDSVIRGVAVAAIPALNAFGSLAVWHVYTVAAIYGLLMMISLAGLPALIPSLVSEADWSTANALETLSFTLASAAAPAIAGVLIVTIGAPNVMGLDAASYFVFAAALARIGDGAPTRAARAAAARPLRESARLLTRSAILRTTTAMFLLFNGAAAGLSVWLPIVVDQRLGAGPRMYGILLGAVAVGRVTGALLAGGWRIATPLGRLICVGQSLAGLSLAVVVLRPGAWLLAAGLFLFGAFSGPLTIWAQTLRMQIIPERLRASTFALLRTIMQSGGPLGGLAAGFVLPIAGVPLTVGISAMVVSGAGLAGLRVSEMWRAGAGAAIAPNHLE